MKPHYYKIEYRSAGKDLYVILQAVNLNQALIEFATKYHQVTQVYGVIQVFDKINQP